MIFFWWGGLFLFSDIFSGLRQAFPAFSDPLSVCAHTGVRGGRRRKLSDKGAIGEQEMAIWYWLFCRSRDVYGADAV